jgi:WD40 repeat protein
MTWPLSQDYNEAIQNPATSFADRELKAGQPALNALGMPLPRSGNFADVYEFQGAKGARWAVKCFTREVRGLRERYSEISKYLRRAKLPFTVDFQYLEQGIRIGSQWYPVLKMQWVEGFLLNEFVRDNIDKPILLDGLAQIWLKMGKRLREAQVAHADLQHGNVILVPGSRASALAVKLIDYDGMWVPSLARVPSGEVGHPAYQHPKRLVQGIYSPEVDRVPLLAVACGLRALAVCGKALWDRYDNGDNLLFRQPDLRDPTQSTLFKELWELPVAPVHDLVGYLALGVTGSLSEVPLAFEVMGEDETRPLSTAQEGRVAALLGPGARISRPATIKAAATKPTAVMVGAGRSAPTAIQPARGQTAVATEEASVWEALGEEEAIQARKRKRRRKSTAVWVAVAGIMVAFGSAVGAVLLMGHDNASRERAARDEGPHRDRPAKPPKLPDDKKDGEYRDAQRDNGKPRDGEAAVDKAVKRRPGTTKKRRPLDNTPSPLDKIPLLSRDGDSKYFPELVAVLKGHLGEIWNVSISPDEKHLAAVGNDHQSVSLWDLTRPTAPPYQKPADFPSNVVFSSDGARLAYATKDTLFLWSIRTFAENRPLYAIPLPGEDYQYLEAHHLAWLPDNKTLLLGRKAGVLRLRLGGQNPPAVPLKGQSGLVRAMAVSPDGSVLATSRRGGIRLLDLKANRHREIGATAEVNCLAFAPDGRKLGAACQDGTVHVYDLTGQDPPEVWAKKGHAHLASWASFAPDGKSLVSSEGALSSRRPFQAVWWKSNDGSQLKQWDLPERCNAVAFSPYSGHLVLGCHNRNIYILRLGVRKRRDKTGTGQVVRVQRRDQGVPRDEGLFFKASRGTISALAVSPDNRIALIATGFNAYLLDVPTGKQLQRLTARGVLQCAAFSLDGRRLLFGTWDPIPNPKPGSAQAHGTMHLWDVDRWQELKRFEHPSPVLAVAFSPDGKRALSGSGIRKARAPREPAIPRDCRLRWWDLDSGKESQFSAQEAEVRSVGFVGDGRHGYSFGITGVTFWDLQKRQAEKSLTQGGGQTIAVYPDGSHFLTVAGRETRLWDIAGNLEHTFGPLPTTPQSVAVSPDGRFAAVGCGELLIRDGKVVMKNRRSISVGCTVYLFDLKNHRQRAVFNGHNQWIYRLAFSGNGRYLLTGDQAGTVRLWDLKRLKDSGDETVKNTRPGTKEPKPDDRAPVPPKIDLDQAEMRIKGQLKDEWSKTKPADRMELVHKLLDMAQEDQADAASRYVALRLAAERSVSAGDILTALAAMDALAERFKEGPLGLKIKLLGGAAVKGFPRAAQPAVVRAALQLANEALLADDFKGARSALKRATISAQKSERPALMSYVAARTQDLAEAEEKWRGLKSTAAKIRSTPKDPAANLDMGKFLCLGKGDWAKGLPLLAKGSNAVLADLAKRDLGGPKGPAAQIQLGDEWRDEARHEAEGEKGLAKIRLLHRACRWYEAAMPDLPPSELVLLTKKIDAIRRTPFFEPPGLIGEVRRFVGHKGRVTAAVLSQDGLRAISGGQDRMLRWWDTTTGRQLDEHQAAGGPIVSVALTADRKKAVSSTEGGIAQLWDLTNEIQAGPDSRFLRARRNVRTVAFSSGGKFVLVGEDNGRFAGCPLEGDQEFSNGNGNRAEGKIHNVLSNNKGILLYIDGDGKLHIYDRPNKKNQPLKSLSPVTCAIFATNGRDIVTGSEDGHVRILKAGGKVVRVFGFKRHHAGPVTSLALSANGLRLLTGGADKFVRVWDPSPTKMSLLHEFALHRDKVRSVSISRDGRFGLSAGDDGTVRLWRLP